MPARRPPLAALGWVGCGAARQPKPAPHRPGPLGFKEKSQIGALRIRKAFLKRNIIFAADPWLSRGAVVSSHLFPFSSSLTYSQDKRTGLRPPLPLPSSWAASGSANTSYSEQNSSQSRFFHVSSKTKAFESSNSCPWRLLHEAKEPKSALKRA